MSLEPSDDEAALPEKKFPDYFPKVKCPPVSATECRRIVHRIVQGSPLKSEDFYNYYELGKPVADLCASCGVSVYDSFETAANKARRNQKFGNSVATGELDESAGVVSLPSSTGHINWWPYDGVDRVVYFTEVTLCTT